MGIEGDVARLLGEGISEYVSEPKRNILYNIFIDGDGKVRPEIKKAQIPSRGDSAYQADVVISATWNNHSDSASVNSIPLVIIEIKKAEIKKDKLKSSLTTHDVLTYSSKALKHKEIYPYLRYGLLYIHPKRKLPQRFFTHNVGFDFAIAVKDYKNEIGDIVKVVKEQIAVSEKLRSAIWSKKSAAISRYSVIARVKMADQEELEN